MFLSNVFFLSPRIFNFGHLSFVENVCTIVINEGKDVFLVNRPKVEDKNPPMRQPSSRYLSSCYQCGKVGHLRPRCHLFRSMAPTKETTTPRIDIENLTYMIKNVVLRFEKFDSSRTVRRRGMNMYKRVEISYPLKGCVKRPYRVGGLGMPRDELHAFFMHLFCLNAYYFVLLMN